MKIPSITQKVLLLFFTFSLVLLCSSSSIAAVRTVSNNPQSPGQYTDLQVACNTAAPHDTIYVTGSITSYGTITVTKPLVLIGSGALPNRDRDVHVHSSKLNFVYFGFSTTDTLSGHGSKIVGFDIGNLVFLRNQANSLAVGSIRVERNRIMLVNFQWNNSDIPSHAGVIIRNNIINAVVGHYNAKLGGVWITNNVFTNINNNTVHISDLGNFTDGILVIANNIFLNGYIYDVNRASIYNNIFYKSNNNGNNLVPLDMPNGNPHYNVISHNLFYSLSNSYSTSSIINGSNTGGNNLLNIDPLFVAFDPTWDGLGSYTYQIPTTNFINLNLQSSSPCLGVSSADGTQMGIYGGTAPYIEGYPANSRFRYFRMPDIPVILDMNIKNTAILPNGTLNVELKARKQN